MKFDPHYKYLGRSVDSKLYREYVRMITGIEVVVDSVNVKKSEELNQLESDSPVQMMATVMDLMDACASPGVEYSALKSLVPSSTIVFKSACTRLAEIASLNDVSMAHFVRTLAGHTYPEIREPLLDEIFGPAPPIDANPVRESEIDKEPFEQLVLEAHFVALEVDSRMSGVVNPERTRSIVSILMNPLDDRIVSLVAEKLALLEAEKQRKAERPFSPERFKNSRLDEAEFRKDFVEEHRKEYAIYVRNILEYKSSTTSPHYDRSYIETISSGSGNGGEEMAKCVLELIHTLEPEQLTLVIQYDQQFLLLHRASGSCDLFHLYVSMVTNGPIALEHERVLDMVLSTSEIEDTIPVIKRLVDACHLPSRGHGDGLPMAGCKALVELASRSDLAMALVIYSIVRKSIPDIFGIKVPLFTDRSEQIEASSIRALVAEVRLAATTTPGMDTISGPVERTKAIIGAVLADRSSSGATAVDETR